MLNELTTCICLHGISLSLLHVNKYGGHEYLTSNSYHYGHKAFLNDVTVVYIKRLEMHLNLN
jgi:hypothetical protein